MQTATENPHRPDLVVVPVLILLGIGASLIEAIKSPDPLMVIQAWTFLACMVGISVFLLRRYGGGAPAEESGTYVNDVVKAGVIASLFWGVAGMLVGLIIALQLAFPHIFYFSDLPFTNFGRLRPLHTSAVDFRLRRKRTDRHLILRRSADLPRASCRRVVRLVCVLGLPDVHRSGGNRISARRHAEPRICGTGMVCRHLADDRLGCLPSRLPRHDLEAAQKSTFT